MDSILKIEACVLPRWSHRDHVWVAYVLLSLPVREGEEDVCNPNYPKIYSFSRYYSGFQPLRKQRFR
jgi:hypothetical protein